MKNVYLRQSLALAAICASTSVWAAGNGMELKSETDKTSYALGYQIGNDFRQQRVDLNNAAVLQGIADARSGAKSLMSEDAMHATLVELKRKVVAQQRAAGPDLVKASDNVAGAAAVEAETGKNTIQPSPHARRLAPQATEGAREFMEKNAKQKGVVSLTSGVQYRVLKDGAGKQPKESDTVALIYRGSLVNGKEFGNTDEGGKPAAKVFPLASLVPGMREAISHMKEGAKWQVFIPPQLGFDASTPLYRKVTVVDVELVAVNP